jgi:hypothetical protein
MLQGGSEMPKRTPRTDELKPLIARVPPAWHAAFERQASKRNRNLNGQMCELVKQFLRETKEIVEDEPVVARDNQCPQAGDDTAAVLLMGSPLS